MVSGGFSGSIGLQYIALTTTTPQLLAVGTVAPSNSASLTVTIPAMITGQECRVYFTDGANVRRASSSFSFPAVSTNFTVYWVGGSSITGKIIVLIDAISGGTITSYNKYGEKTNYTLNNGGVQTQTFAASDINVVPGNATVTGSVTVPAGAYTGTMSELRIKFGNAGSTLGGSILYPIAGNTFTYNVPTGLTTTPTFFVTGSATGPSAGSFTFKGNIVSVPSTGNNVILESVSTLSSPPDAATNINISTNFTYSPGTGTGVNLVSFIGPVNTFYVFTTGTTVKIPDLSALGLGIGASAVYTWEVPRFLSYSSVDQLVTSAVNNNSIFNGETVSGSRTFTTAP
jgi:hypothetical protein